MKNKTVLGGILIAMVVVILFLLGFGYKEGFHDKPYFLGLLLQVKNEAMIIDEFVRHYQWQGLDHMYVIDNGSTDETKEVIQPYIDAGFITYFYMPEKGQETNYNRVYPAIRDECEWLIICDTDEYIYNRTAGETIKDRLQTLDKMTSHIALNWKMFSSSGHDKQPDSIRSSFQHRWNEPTETQKNIVQTANTTSVGIHSCQYESGSRPAKTDDLALNHYAIMSREYFEKVKMTRGDATTDSLNSIRDWKYFNDYDKSETKDDELAILVQQSTPVGPLQTVRQTV